MVSNQHQPAATLKRRILVVTLALFLAQQWLGTAAAVAAGIVPAANAPAAQHPLTDTARNGVPIVDVAPPSAAGVSNNQYSQFNTASNGAILNNSAGNVQTRLGGWIAGNPMLGSTPAKVILNQVTSGNPSQLLGALEVAGQAADVVVANPAGIACSGCSFINTPHATLTTGLPQFDASGHLSGFNVTQGVIAVGAGGLDAQQAERLDLDARGLTLQGGIWARQLGVVAGAALVPYGSTQAAAQAGSGNAPEFAVDVSALGGMYADTIDLVATDAGLGVNSQGRLAALQGNLRLSANGKLTLADTSAAGGLQLSGGDVSLNGITASTGGSLQVQAAGALANGGSVDSAGSLRAQAASLVDTGGSWNAQGDLSLQAGSLRLSGTTLQSGGDVTLAATTGDLQATGAQITGQGALSASAGGTLASAGGHWQAGGKVTLQGEAITNGAVVLAGGSLQASAAQALDNSGGKLQSAGSLTAGAATIINSGGAIQSNQAVALSASGSIVNRGGNVSAGGTLGIDAGSATLDNTAGLLAAAQSLSLDVQALSNAQSGTSAGIQSGGALSITASTLSNDTGFIGSDAGLSLRVGGLLANGSGTLQSGASLDATAAQISGGGAILAGGPLSLQAQSLGFSGATLQSGGATTLQATAGDLQVNHTGVTSVGDLSASATGTLSNTAGAWASGGNATLQGASVTNSGSVQAGSTLSATASGSLDNAGGQLLAGGDLSATGSSIGNDGGTMASAGAAIVTAPQGLSNQGGTVSGATQLKVDAGASALNNGGGTLVSGGAATIGAGTLSNAAGTIAAVGDLQLGSAALDNSAGKLQTTGNLSLSTQGQALGNAGGRIEAAGSASLATGALDNTQGTLSANALSLNLGALTNDGGKLVSSTTLDATTGAVRNTAGLIEAGGDLSLDTQGTALSNTASATTGGIVAGGTLSLRSGTLANTSGVIASHGDQNLNVGTDLDNAGGSIATQGQLNLTAGGTLGNAGGSIAAGQSATLSAATLDNSAGGQISAQDLSLRAGTVGNHAGTLQAAQDASVTTASLDNTSGLMSAGHQLEASATALANSGGTLVGNAGLSLSTSSSSFGGTLNSTGTVDLTVNGAYDNTGTVSTQGDLNIQAASITNESGAVLASGGHLSATTTGDLSNAGTLDAAGSTTLSVGGLLANSGLIDSGSATNLSAATLANTGRIYGGTVGITAGSLSNSGGAVIASRGDMAIAARTIGNTGDSTILALGSLSIAGSFDPTTGVATSATSSLLNASSTLQAGANLSIDAASVTNRNDHLVLGTTMSTQALTDTVLKVQGTSPATALLDASTLGYVAHGNPVDGGRAYWVLPSTRYPFSVFGAAPLQQEIVSDCSGVSADGLGSCTTSYTYGVTDPIWQKFGVTPPPPAPVPPAGAPIYSGSDAQGNPIVLSCADPSTGQPILSGACGTYWQQENAYDTTATQAQVQQAETSLDQAITAFNADQSSRIISQYVEYHVDSQTTVTPTVVSTDPARILAGGNLTVTGGGAGSLLNADSAIVAAGQLDIASGVLDNQSTTGTQTLTQSGSVDVWASDGGTWDSSNHLRCNGWNYPPCGPGAAYTTQSSSTVDLNTVTVVSGGNPGAGSAPTVTPVAPSGVAASAVAAPRAIATQAPGGPGALAAQAVGAVQVHAPPSLQQLSVPGAGGGAALVVSTSPPTLNLPGNQLFQIDPAPGAPYLVETDPAFTNQRSFLSSDYYLQQLAVDPSQWQLRYGDGFAEQQLVQNQILALTGRDILASYANTQAEYQALMNAGVAYAKAYGIAPGVSLSAAQMALVTTDMVLLTTQTLTLPDGTVKQVLVPQVYLAHPQGQDLSQGGALIAGGSVTLSTAQDLANSGTIEGASVQATAGHDLVNRGTIAGQDILLSASNDLKNLSGLIQGTSDTSSLSLLAGRDLVLQTQAIPVQGTSTTTSTTTSATAGSTSLGHVATVQGGSITLQAARDLVAQGAQVASTGDLTALAGRNLQVGATTTTYQFSAASHAGDTLAVQQSGSTQHGSTLSAGGDATLVAQGGALTVQASQVSAGHDATLSGQDVTVAAGVNSASDATQLQWSAGHASLADSSQSAAAAGVSAGNNVTVQATGNGQAGSGDLTVTGAGITASQGQATLQAAHDLNVGTLALAQSSSAEVHSESHGWLSSGSSSTHSSSSSTANASGSISGSAVSMTAGHDLNVLGSMVAGTGIAAGSGQVSLTAGNTLNVVAAADTQSSHSDTHSSGGLFGSDKAQSSADLSQTTAQASSLTGSHIQLQSGSDMTLQAAQIAGQSLHAQAGVVDGQVVDPNATLHIDAAINDLSESRSSSGHGLLTQSTAGKGKVEQTLQYTTIDVPGASQAGGPVQLQATGGIAVGASSLSPAGSTASGGTGVPTITVDLKQQAQQLASQPGLAYLGQLAQRHDVAWQQVQLASQSWDYHQSGLTGVGAAIVAVAVACATGGMGAGLVGATTTSTAAMANAAFTTLVTQASTALIANGGNLGAALRTLGSSASVKSLVASIATAGLENVQLAGGQSLNQMSGLSNLGQTDTSLASSSAVTTSTMEGIAGRAVASAGVDSLMQGTSFGQGLIDSTVSDASALGAFAIGDARATHAFGSGVGGELGYVGSHALLGCAAGAAAGAGCGGQAIGAAVSAVTANGIADLVSGGQGVSSSGQLAAITGATTLLGAGAAAALGQNPNAAVTGASNETLNNTCADGHDCGEDAHPLPEIAPGQNANPADPASEEKAFAQEGEVAAFAGGAAGAAAVSGGVSSGTPRGGGATNNTIVATYGPMNPGPLSTDVVDTFRSGTYTEMVAQQPTTLYRVYGGTANLMGSYWTVTPPAGPVQSVIDSALLPQWGNPGTNVVTIEIPVGTTYFIGAAAPQGGLVGGGSQVVFPAGFRINPLWIKMP